MEKYIIILGGNPSFIPCQNNYVPAKFKTIFNDILAYKMSDLQMKDDQGKNETYIILRGKREK